MPLPKLFLGVLMLAASGAASADPVDLKPFRATYVAQWKGMTAASSMLFAIPTPPFLIRRQRTSKR